jgi:hypothetical protein
VVIQEQISTLNHCHSLECQQFRVPRFVTRERERERERPGRRALGLMGPRESVD